MNQSRLKELFQDYNNSLSRLQDSLKEDISISSTIIDGTIQRFEFVFELAWKLMRLTLKEQGIEVNSPKSTIKEAFRIKLIKDGDGWIDMLEDRNKTSHIYDESESKKIYEKIKKFHIKLLEGFAKDIRDITLN